MFLVILTLLLRIILEGRRPVLRMCMLLFLPLEPEEVPVDGMRLAPLLEF